jgi:AraC-like DNA-binding protein
MNKQQFQAKIKALQAKGITIEEIAKKIGFNSSSIYRAKRSSWKGDSSRVFWAFSKVFK